MLYYCFGRPSSTIGLIERLEYFPLVELYRFHTCNEIKIKFILIFSFLEFLISFNNKRILEIILATDINTCLTSIEINFVNFENENETLLIIRKNYLDLSSNVSK